MGVYHDVQKAVKGQVCNFDRTASLDTPPGTGYACRVMDASASETYISVDVETAGPTPRRHALLAIGACTLDTPQRTFYAELKPTHPDFTAEALAVSGLSLEDLHANGLEPAEAMQRFAAWLDEVTPPGNKPVFVAFNAPFDWMFVNEYFHTHLGYNPFGHAALDIKAYYMGMAGVAWRETAMHFIGKRYLEQEQLTHNALQDAQDQGEIFRRLLAERRPGPPAGA